MRKEEFETPELTRASSKGQIVIPTTIRNKLGIKEGSVFGITSRKNMIVLKKLDTKIKAEDLRTLKVLEEAWKDIEEGRCKVYSKEAFFKELKKW
jgi:AbrB family looped-hinge helix DNA binding protein